MQHTKSHAASLSSGLHLGETMAKPARMDIFLRMDNLAKVPNKPVKRVAQNSADTDFFSWATLLFPP